MLSFISTLIVSPCHKTPTRNENKILLFLTNFRSKFLTYSNSAFRFEFIFFFWWKLHLGVRVHMANVADVTELNSVNLQELSLKMSVQTRDDVIVAQRWTTFLLSTNWNWKNLDKHALQMLASKNVLCVCCFLISRSCVFFWFLYLKNHRFETDNVIRSIWSFWVLKIFCEQKNFLKFSKNQN